MNKITFFFVLFFLNFVAQAQNTPPFLLKSRNCAWGLQDISKKEIIFPIQYNSITYTPVGKDWLIEAKESGKTNYFLYQEGKFIPLAYSLVEKLNDRLLKVGEKGLYGAVNTEGKGVLVLNYKNILPAGNEFLTTILNQKYGIVGIDGKQILPNHYLQISHWEMGGFWAMSDKQLQLYDLTGKIVSGAIYDAVKPSAIMPFCAVSKDGKWGIIDSKNKTILPFQNDGIDLMEGGLVAVLKDQKWQLMDEKGQKKSKQSYEKIQNLSTQFILVVQKEKKGLLDQKGNIVLEPIYQEIYDVGNNWVAVSEGTGFKIYDINKKTFLTHQFESVKFGKKEEDWTGILFQQNQKWGWLDFNGNILITPIYTQAAPSMGNILVTGDNQMVGLINPQGQPILPLEYKSISPYNGFFKVKKAMGAWFYVNEKNEEVPCPF